MTQEMRTWLDTIEITDTSETLTRLAEIREQARNEVEEENRKKVAHDPVN